MGLGLGEVWRCTDPATGRHVRFIVLSNEIEFTNMRDPHVGWPEYGMKAGWLFEAPPPVDWETPVCMPKVAPTSKTVVPMVSLAGSTQASKNAQHVK